MKTIGGNRQTGAVSLFVVIFATLLITVVTISFLRLMVSDQNKASNNDLSQSAYDSAQAGVEDAKRALLRYQKICDEGGQAACDAAASEINNVACNNALRVGDVVSGSDVSGGTGSQTGEVKIQQSTSQGDASLDQAYTCVTLNLLTDDYIGSLASGQSKLVPLIGKSTTGSTYFDRVQVEWFTSEDIGSSASGTYAVNLPGVATSQPLLSQTDWVANRPSVLRTELMQFGSNFILSSFDRTTGSGQSNANTLFLYPTSAVTASSETFTSRDSRVSDSDGNIQPKDRTDTPLPVHCENNLSAGGYACRQALVLPEPVGGGNRTAFLRVTPYYNATHFRVTLYNGAGTVQFNGVQPEVDSTGRANDVFRRVVSRVDLIDTSFPYPDGAVDVTGSICKNFAVTDTAYIASTGTACTP